AHGRWDPGTTRPAHRPVTAGPPPLPLSLGHARLIAPLPRAPLRPKTTPSRSPPFVTARHLSLSLSPSRVHKPTAPSPHPSPTAFLPLPPLIFLLLPPPLPSATAFPSFSLPPRAPRLTFLSPSLSLPLPLSPLTSLSLTFSHL